MIEQKYFSTKFGIKTIAVLYLVMAALVIGLLPRLVIGIASEILYVSTTSLQRGLIDLFSLLNFNLEFLRSIIRVFSIIWAFLLLFIGIGLLFGKRLARKAGIITSLLQAIPMLFYVSYNNLGVLLPLTLQLSICFYLSFNKGVKNYFKI